MRCEQRSQAISTIRLKKGQEASTTFPEQPTAAVIVQPIPAKSSQVQPPSFSSSSSSFVVRRCCSSSSIDTNPPNDVSHQSTRQSLKMPGASVAVLSTSASSTPVSRKTSLAQSERKYKCQFCATAFSRSEHRSRHERTRKWHHLSPSTEAGAQFLVLPSQPLPLSLLCCWPMRSIVRLDYPSTPSTP